MTLRRPLFAAQAVLLAALLGGCSSLPFLSDDKPDAGDDTEAPAPAGRAVYELDVQAPGPLRTLLLN